jgi:hypothetical protein
MTLIMTVLLPVLALVTLAALAISIANNRPYTEPVRITTRLPKEYH